MPPGGHVLATAGTKNQETLKPLGVDVAIDYTQDDVVETVLEDTAGAGVDAVLYAVGGDTVAPAFRRRDPAGGSPPSSAGRETSRRYT